MHLYRTKRLLTYNYILKKRAKEFQRELIKSENKNISILIILKKIISNEKLVIPRLKIFEKIAPSYLD